MKFVKILTIILIGLFLFSIASVMADHNEEFPENACDDPDHTINITAEGEKLEFIIGGEVNPDIQVDAGSCVEVTFENTSDLEHDFTIVDETVSEDDEFFEIIHMDTPVGNTTNHLWRMPDKNIDLMYFCEVPGHREGGMEGNFRIGSGSGLLPGFEFPLVIAGLFALIAIPIVRRRFR